MDDRYQRGSRSLAANLSQPAKPGGPVTPSLGRPDLESEAQEEDYDIPEEIENVIGECFHFYRTAFSFVSKPYPQS